MCFNKSESNPRGVGLPEYYSGDDGKLKVLMATQSSLESFNPAAESIEDYKERFDFHCTAHQIPEGRRKALFLTRIGRDAFAKLKTLVSPTPLNDLSLSAIVTTMSVKADLAIYCLVLGVSGWCMSVPITYRQKMDFSSCV